MHLLVELVFDIYVTSMELQSFEKPYVTLLNSANWVLEPMCVWENSNSTEK
jgi:hypothetical protein